MVVQHKLVVFNRPSKLGLERVWQGNSFDAGRFIDDCGSPPVRLGVVKCGVVAREEVVWILAVLRGKGDADAGARIKFMAKDVVRFADIL